jgi:hypothetical protein
MRAERRVREDLNLQENILQLLHVIAQVIRMLYFSIEMSQGLVNKVLLFGVNQIADAWQVLPWYFAS